MSAKKELKQLQRRAECQGWVVTTTGGNHLKWVPPDPSCRFVITPSSPGEGRAMKNVKARLRRNGLVV